MKKELMKLEAPELTEIEVSRAKQIRETFLPMAEMLEEFEGNYKKVIKASEKGITEQLTADAKRLRLDISRVRIKTEKIRVAQKAEYLRAGKAIDGVANVLKWAVMDKEDELKKIEKYYENKEKERLEKLQRDRVEALSKYVDDAQDRNLSGMDDDVWRAYLATKKKEYEDRLEAERKAEQERIAREKAEKEEQERIRRENERLRKEAEAREAREKAEAEAREKAEAKRKEQERKERAEYQAKMDAERAERERVERELRQKKQAEEQARKEAEEKKQAELRKGDAEKVDDLIDDLIVLKTKYTFKSERDNDMYAVVKRGIDGVVKYIRDVKYQRGEQEERRTR